MGLYMESGEVLTERGKEHQIEDIKGRFKEFFSSFVDRKTGVLKYRERLNTMAVMNQRSLVIDFEDLLVYDMELARIIELYPDMAIEAASQAIKELLLKEHPDYAETVERFYPRFKGLPRTIRIRDLGSDYIGKLVSIEGIVVRMTRVEAKIVKARFKHVDPECGNEFDWPPFGGLGERIEKPPVCPICGKPGRLQLLLDKSKFIDWQKIVVQEKPEEVPAGQMPRSIEVILTGDLVDVIRPGDRVVITGILRVLPTASTSKGAGKSVFELYIDANYVDVQQKVLEEIEITREDEEKIKEMARDPWIREKIIASIAPFIYGNWDIKEAIALQLFGGVPKVLEDGTRIRGDIHVLLVGDPGIGKSMLLQYAARIAPRAVFTSGKGSTAAGLTAAVLRDKQTGEYYLEAGALVIADGGLAVIDEIDKMRPEDRVAIHEAMEQQSYYKDFELILADGRKVKIGEFVDKLIEQNRDKVVIGIDTEILFTRNLDIYVLAYDLKNRRIVKVKADRVSRHKAPQKFVKITFSNGRSIIVTPEHPIVVWDESRREFTMIRAGKVKPGVLVPGVKRLEIHGSNHRHLDLEYLLTLIKDGKITRLPPEIYIAHVNEKILFINKLFREYGFSEKHCLGFNVTSRGFAEDLQDLLLTLGIGSIVECNVHDNECKVIVNDVDLFINLVSENTRSRNVHREYFDGGVSSLELVVDTGKQSLSKESLDDNLTFVKVIDVEYVENSDSKWVYDVTVEPYHLFVSHGLVLHNTISIAKAGIVARLNARAAVLAAGNPKYGRYDFERTIADNINLPPTILSRFDLIFIMRDVPDVEQDRRMARHILGVHKDVEKIKPIIPPDILRKYISYARRYVKPRLTEEARKLLEDFYVMMRRSGGSRSPIPITARQLEALVRLAEAHAKMALKPVVTVEDAEEAIRLMSKMLSTVGVDVETGRIDIDTLMVGKPRSQQEKMKLFIEILDELSRSSPDGRVKIKELVNKAKEKGLTPDFVSKTIKRMLRSGELYEPEPGYIAKVS